MNFKKMLYQGNIGLCALVSVTYILGVSIWCLNFSDKNKDKNSYYKVQKCTIESNRNGYCSAGTLTV